jgi:hypothetical protein
MKKIILAISTIALITATVFVSCKKDEAEAPYTCTTCNQTPEAVAANDASSKGIYKGIIIGSSGTIKFDVANTTSNSITATMVIDGTTVTLTSSVTWTAGQLYVAPFTGTLNGQPVSITFSVTATGSSPTITASNIPGHANAIFSISKETSTALVRCFEGTYHTSANEDGTFNILISTLLKGWGGKARKNGATTASDISGSFVNDILYDGPSGNKIATVTGDTFDGSFVDANNTTITVKGKRTL